MRPFIETAGGDDTATTADTSPKHRFIDRRFGARVDDDSRAGRIRKPPLHDDRYCFTFFINENRNRVGRENLTGLHLDSTVRTLIAKIDIVANLADLRTYFRIGNEVSAAHNGPPDD